MNFGYTVPEKITKRASIEKVRVYLTAENLFYISERQGFDPRYNVAGYTNPELYSPMRTCSFGIQFTF
jgi:hypothetical protein